MSGIFHEGRWYENTDMICRRCGRPVYDSDNPEYRYPCFHCDEDFYSIEVEEQDALYLPPVMVARPVDGITLNEALEYLLYITNARKDTNQLAHDLMGRFGDFAGVLEATEEDLLTVEGVGPATARMLHLLPAVSRYYTQCRTNGKTSFKTTEQLAVYLLRLFAGAEQERALLLALDGRSRIKATLWLKDGTGDRVSLAIKDVVAAALKGLSLIHI